MSSPSNALQGLGLETPSKNCGTTPRVNIYERETNISLLALRSLTPPPYVVNGTNATNSSLLQSVVLMVWMAAISLTE